MAGLSACGYSSDSKEVVEGEPVKLGELQYNVIFSRFLNPNDTEDAAYLDELAALEQANPNYRLVATMTQPEASARPWKGETGQIRPGLLKRHLPDLKSPVYYCAGPQGMAMAMELMLSDLGASDEDVRSEEFYGY